LVVSEEASVCGQIHADHVIINGHVKGPVHALTLLELQPKARIEGDVSYKALEMHQGATIAGQLKPMGVEQEDKPTLKLAANNL
jgi:cytoskeletal protein CcmA (bactofilin family)